jgi:starvation-inducible DNA-binding protein
MADEGSGLFPTAVAPAGTYDPGTPENATILDPGGARMKTNNRVVDGLNGLLADSTVFYQKLRHYHWNVEGRHFFELHAKFEEIYTRWADSIDEIAERILMVGGVPLHTLKSMLETASLDEDESTPAAAQMVDLVAADLQALHARAGEVIEAAEAADDRGTANMLDALRDAMEKDVWMLRAWKREAAGSWS